MRGRLVFAAAAVVAVLALLAWGLLPGAAKNTTVQRGSAAPAAAVKSPYVVTPAVPDVSKMRLAFSSDFAGSTLDASVWGTCYPWAAQASAGCTNFSNPEHEWYRSSQVRVSSGTLDLVAQPIKTLGYTKTGTWKNYTCRSGMVTSFPSFNFKYGYVQVVARMPSDPDLWPGLWLAASNLNWPPEIDLAEHWSAPDNVTGIYFHPAGAAPVTMVLPKATNVTSGWHTFAVNWTPTQITWYLDNHVEMVVKQRIPHQKMYFVANLASFNIKKHKKQQACSGTLAIKSVKVWKS